jgi:hypothetical protein
MVAALSHARDTGTGAQMEANSTPKKALDGLQTAEPGSASSRNLRLEGALVIGEEQGCFQWGQEHRLVKKVNGINALIDGIQYT